MKSSSKYKHFRTKNHTSCTNSIMSRSNIHKPDFHKVDIKKKNMLEFIRKI